MNAAIVGRTERRALQTSWVYTSNGSRHGTRTSRPATTSVSTATLGSTDTPMPATTHLLDGLDAGELKRSVRAHATLTQLALELGAIGTTRFWRLREEERLSVAIRGADDFDRRQATAGCGDDADRLAQQSLGVQARNPEWRIQDECHVNVAARYRSPGLATEPSDRRRSEHDRYPRVARAEGAQDRRQPVGQQRFRGADHDRSLESAFAHRDGRHGGSGLLGQLEQLFGVREQRFAGHGQDDRPTEPVEQPDPELTLKGMDLGADRRLDVAET
jgi:hypothetical protein